MPNSALNLTREAGQANSKKYLGGASLAKNLTVCFSGDETIIKSGYQRISFSLSSGNSKNKKHNHIDLLYIWSPIVFSAILDYLKDFELLLKQNFGRS